MRLGDDVLKLVVVFLIGAGTGKCESFVAGWAVERASKVWRG